MINSQRDELIRANEKFMKDARKRMEEKRKILIEKQVDKTVKKVIEVKKEDD